MVERDTKTTIVYAMQNSLQKDKPYAAFMGINFHTKIAREAGYDEGKIEYFPFQGASFQLRFIPGTDTSLINSSHQSFGSGKFPDKFGMRGKIPSLQDLVILQSKNPKILSVVFPFEPSNGETRPQEFNKLKRKVFQPTKNLMQEYGLQKTVDLITFANNEKYRIVLDLFHIRRSSTKDGSFMENWQDVIRTLIDKVDEIHVGLGRVDFHGNFDSMEELVDIYSGTEKTEVVKMLKMIKELGWTGPIVTEIDARSLLKLLGQNGKVVTPSMLIQAHTQIVKNLRDLMLE